MYSNTGGIRIHVYTCIYMRTHTYVYMHICISEIRRKIGMKIICQRTQKNKKYKILSIYSFVLLFIVIHSERKLEFLKYHDFKKCPKGKLYILFVRSSSFVWILPFICSVMLFAYSQFADTGKTFLAHTRNKRTRKFSTFVRPHSKARSSPVEV